MSEDQEYDTRTAQALIRLGQRLEAGVQEVTAPRGIRPRHLHVLALVAGGPLSQRELSDRTGQDRTTMVATIDELERVGLAVRRRGERDRRRYFVVPTEAGRECLDAVQEELRIREQAVFGVLATDERAQLDNLVRRLSTPEKEPSRMD